MYILALAYFTIYSTILGHYKLVYVRTLKYTRQPNLIKTVELQFCYYINARHNIKWLELFCLSATYVVFYVKCKALLANGICAADNVFYCSKLHYGGL